MQDKPEEPEHFLTAEKGLADWAALEVQYGFLSTSVPGSTKFGLSIDHDSGKSWMQ